MKSIVTAKFMREHGQSVPDHIPDEANGRSGRPVLAWPAIRRRQKQMTVHVTVAIIGEWDRVQVRVRFENFN